MTTAEIISQAVAEYGEDLLGRGMARQRLADWARNLLRQGNEEAREFLRVLSEFPVPYDWGLELEYLQLLGDFVNALAKSFPGHSNDFFYDFKEEIVLLILELYPEQCYVTVHWDMVLVQVTSRAGISSFHMPGWYMEDLPNWQEGLLVELKLHYSSANRQHFTPWLVRELGTEIFSDECLEFLRAITIRGHWGVLTPDDTLRNIADNLLVERYHIGGPLPEFPGMPVIVEQADPRSPSYEAINMAE